MQDYQGIILAGREVAKSSDLSRQGFIADAKRWKRI
jgi:hypothetical protein